jgi:DNA-binding HxlR family transcriptional regulator
MSTGTLDVTDYCRPATELFQRIGEKWTLTVVGRLWDGPMRFSELRRVMPAISQRMLTLTLRALERDGLVTRTVTPTVPMRSEYELTALGRSLGECVRVLGDWAFANHVAIATARTKFDARGDVEPGIGFNRQNG